MISDNIPVTLKTFNRRLGIFNEKSKAVDGVINTIARDIGESVKGVYLRLVSFANPRDAGFGFYSFHVREIRSG